MCEKTNYKTPNTRVDKCMVEMIDILKAMSINSSIKPVASCCGHGKYNMSIVVSNGKSNWDLITGINIPRKRRFYKRDSDGYYYIPEIVDVK